MKSVLIFLVAFLALANAARFFKVEKPIEDTYIIVFHENTTEPQAALHLNYLSADNTTTLLHQYKHSIKGYAAQIPSRNTLAKLMSDPIVDFVENDQWMHALACTSQTGATWGISRVSNTALGISSYKYEFDGTGIDAYIVDTGILITHTDFEGRASFGFKATASWSNTDANGHGTHVASTTGGKTYGIAKKVTLIAVKVLGDNGSGTNAGVIAGVDYVGEQAAKTSRKSVANMSLGGGKSTALDAAVNNAVTKNNVAFAVAAGNDNNDARNYSPASAADAICVGASAQGSVGGRQADVRSTFSNYGTTVHVFAPGTGITAAWIGSNSATNTISGTSMASPHVCGVAALLRQQNPSYTAQQIRSTIINTAQEGVITLNCGNTACNGSPNKLLQKSC